MNVCWLLGHDWDWTSYFLTHHTCLRCGKVEPIVRPEQPEPKIKDYVTSEWAGRLN